MPITIIPKTKPIFAKSLKTVQPVMINGGLKLRRVWLRVTITTNNLVIKAMTTPTVDIIANRIKRNVTPTTPSDDPWLLFDFAVEVTEDVASSAITRPTEKSTELIFKLTNKKIIVAKKNPKIIFFVKLFFLFKNILF